jgi:hypothetical protein
MVLDLLWTGGVNVGGPVRIRNLPWWFAGRRGWLATMLETCVCMNIGKVVETESW